MLDISIENKVIIDYVEDSLEEVCLEFHSYPSHFFTENDLVCRFYQAFHKRIGNMLVEDVEGKKHSILHTEYPTPFRRDMHGSHFDIKIDDERTPSGKKYRRGHYDVVIINPEIIKQLSLEDIRFQNFSLSKNNVLSKVNSGNPMILYGLEFLYKRRIRSNNGAKNFIDEIRQDHEKLVQSTNLKEDGHKGFLFKYKTIAFFEDVKYKGYIEEAFKDIANVRLVVPK